MGRFTIFFAQLQVVVAQPPLLLNRDVEIPQNDLGFEIAPRVIEHALIVLTGPCEYQYENSYMRYCFQSAVKILNS